jgi:hypothetical protein
MKIQRQITSILSTMLITGMFLVPPLQAQQSNSQPSAAQQPQQQNQPAAQQPAPANTQPAAPAGQNQQDQSQQAQPQQNQPQQNQPQQNPNPSGTTVNPSQAPLAPITTYPDASGAQQQQQPSTTNPAQTNVPEGPQPKKQTTEPVGAATAESVPTAGGAAAKPAGVAIAPAKQHQTRSWLIKIGAVVAAGAAAGTVYALSRSTPSTPPGSNSPGAVPKSGTVHK